MSKVSTACLDAEARHAGTQHGSIVHGSLDANKLIGLLENFQSIDPMELIDSDPQVMAVGNGCKLTIRTVRKKLFVYNSENMNEAAAEMTPAEIVQRLGNTTPATAGAAAPVEGTEPSALPTAPGPARAGQAWLLVAVIVLINGYTGYSLFQQSRTEKWGLTFVLDDNEIAKQGRIFAGTYAAGSHTLIVSKDGLLQYEETGTGKNSVLWAGTYHVALQGQETCLSIDGGGIISASDNNTLTYAGETFHRIQ
ncbi:MAG TPA: hypothetical protein VNU49_02780 [Opitutaceae bacterium]|jgi:hypothetical protein|nr:hypothetical protein [Opitutaceae bacterium]